MERRRSKKPGDNNARPSSGGTHGSRPKGGEPSEDSVIQDPPLPSKHVVQPSVPASPVNIPAPTRLLESPDISLPQPSRLVTPVETNALGRFLSRTMKREDFVVQMMEDGSLDQILKLISQVAEMFSNGLPVVKVIDELARLIHEEQGTQKEINAKMAALKQENRSLQSILLQLQQENAELKKAEDARTKNLSSLTPDVPDSRHGNDDKKKKNVSSKNERKKK